MNVSTYTLDGDNIRLGISNDLGFSPEDRTENIRRIAEIGNLFIDAGVVTLACFVSPYINDRDNVKKLLVMTIILRYLLMQVWRSVSVEIQRVFIKKPEKVKLKI